MNNKLDEKRINFSVKEEKTLISALKENFSSTPLSLIHKLLRTKKVLVNSVQVRYYQHRVKKGSVITVSDSSVSFSKKKKFIKPLNPSVSFEVVYEDENIIVVLKDHNIETHNKNNPSESLDNAVSYYLLNSNDFDLKDDLVVSSSHRIDKLTKGLVLYAKNSSSKRIFHTLFGKKENIIKKYIAVCSGSVDVKSPGEVKGYLHKEESEKRMIFSYEKVVENSLECSMFIEKIASNLKHHAFEVTIFTGRKHQIRSFFSFIKCPIIGDEKYGSKIKLNKKIKLFAYSMEFKDMPKEFCYLNNKKLEVKRIKKLVVSQISSSKEGVLPRKFIKD